MDAALRVRSALSSYQETVPGVATDTDAPPHPYAHHRFPAEIISHGVWLSCRVCLSYRDGEALRFARGVMVTDEAIRQWCRTFGQPYEPLKTTEDPGQ
jgi:transposase-like protein